MTLLGPLLVGSFLWLKAAWVADRIARDIDASGAAPVQIGRAELRHLLALGCCLVVLYVMIDWVLPEIADVFVYVALIDDDQRAWWSRQQVWYDILPPIFTLAICIAVLVKPTVLAKLILSSDMNSTES